MDTDDLSEETYRGILLAAEKLNHWLTVEFGVRAEDCETEKDFLDMSVKLARRIKRMSKPYLEDIFWGDVPDKKELHASLDEIIANCEQLIKIPPDKKTYTQY